VTKNQKQRLTSTYREAFYSVHFVYSLIKQQHLIKNGDN